MNHTASSIFAIALLCLDYTSIDTLFFVFVASFKTSLSVTDLLRVYILACVCKCSVKIQVAYAHKATTKFIYFMKLIKRVFLHLVIVGLRMCMSVVCPPWGVLYSHVVIHQQRMLNAGQPNGTLKLKPARM